jgi:hypothetical protein
MSTILDLSAQIGGVRLIEPRLTTGLFLVATTRTKQKNSWGNSATAHDRQTTTSDENKSKVTQDRI